MQRETQRVKCAFDALEMERVVEEEIAE